MERTMSNKDPEMNEIEAALAAWTPSEPRVERDRLMFAAGRASLERPAIVSGLKVTSYLWPCATTLSTAAALVMAFLLAQNHAERAAWSSTAARSTIAVSTPAAIAESTPADSPPLRSGISLPAVADGTYLALRNRLLKTPLDEWPVANFLSMDGRSSSAAVEDDATRPAPTSRNLLQEFLPRENESEQPDPIQTPAAFSAEPYEAFS
jgi:hypothetical protein